MTITKLEQNMEFTLNHPQAPFYRIPQVLSSNWLCFIIYRVMYLYACCNSVAKKTGRDTAGIGRMGPPRKIDLFLIDHFVIFSIRTIKMYSILVDYIGNVVMKKYMHAAIHWIIR